MIKRTFFLSLLIVVCFQNLSYANDYSKGILDVKKVYESSKNISSKKYPNSDAVILDNKIICNINDKGLGSQWGDQFVKILTQQGVENNKVQSFQYSLPYWKTEILKAEIIKTDGQIIEINTQKQSHVIIDPNQINANIFNPNDKQLDLNIPNLQIGDIIRVITQTKYVQKMINNMWAHSFLVQYVYPIIHKEITITMPKSLPLKNITIQKKVINTVLFTKNKNKKSIVYNWKINNVPRFFPEDGMPEFKGMPLLLVSTFPNWQYMSKWNWSISISHINAVNEALRDKVKELIKNKKTDLEKIKALYYYVSDNIRYLQTNNKKNEPWDYVQNASYIFDSKTGICRNKALLLISMLRLAGFKSYPTMVSVGMQLNKKVPTIQFDHAIVAIELKPNQYTLLDPTMGDRSKKIFPSWLSGSTYLVCTPTGEPLKIVPSLPAKKNSVSIKTTCNIDVNDKLFGKTIIEPHGLNSTQMRQIFSSYTPEFRKIFFNFILQRALPNTEINQLSFHPANLLDMHQNLQIVLEFSNTSPFVQGKNIAVMNLPWFGKKLNLLFQNRDFGLKTRQFPLKLYSTSGYEETITVSYKDTDFDHISLPKTTLIDSKNITYRQNYGNNNKVINAERTFLNKAMELSPAEYLNVKNNLKNIEASQVTPLILEKPMPKSTSKFSKVSTFAQSFINYNISIDIKNEHNWEKNIYVKKKILSHTELIKNAELKIPYNPIWESVKLTNASTVTSKGKKLTVEKKDIHIMDQNWTASAPRYPEGKILVANFPGVDVGSVIEYELEYQNKNKPFFSEIISLKFMSPIDDFKLTLSAPEDMSINIDSKNLIGVESSMSRGNGQTTYKWSSRNIDGNIPEVSTPPKWVFNPTIFLSNGNWKQYYKKIKKQIISSVSNNKDIKKLTEELIKNDKNDNQKLIAVRDFVAKNIRLAGPAFIDLPFPNISNADITLKDGYGNSADRAILLYSMLKTAGFSPEFILVSEYPNIDLITTPLLKTPQRSLFNYILVRVKTKEGYIYLNDTNQYSKLGATPSQYNLATLLEDSSTFIIEPLTNTETRFVNNYNIVINDDSSASYQLIFDMYGTTYADKNKFYSQIKPKRREQHYQKLIAGISQDAESVSKLETNFDTYPGTRKCTIKINDFCSIENNFNYFRTLVNIKSPSFLGPDTRNYPYYLPYPINHKYNINIKLLKEYEKALIIPVDATYYMPNNSGIISVKSKIEKNKKGETVYKENIKIDIKPSIYTPQQFQKIVKIYNAITSPSINTLLFKK